MQNWGGPVNRNEFEKRQSRIEIISQRDVDPVRGKYSIGRGANIARTKKRARGKSISFFSSSHPEGPVTFSGRVRSGARRKEIKPMWQKISTRVDPQKSSAGFTTFVFPDCR